jgi:tetratricopeptide (TPR) repeat protein
MRFGLLLILAGLMAFGGSVDSGFHYDDHAIFADRAITSSSGWYQVWRPEQTRPLTYFTFWLNHQFGGSNPQGYHAVNLALHLACVLLLYDVLGQLMPQRLALLAAALFAVHPIQTEAVAYVWERGTLLATLFCLLTFRTWLRGRRWLSVGFFALALLSKEECVAFPLFLLLLSGHSGRKPWIWKPAAAMLALSAAAAARVFYALSLNPQVPAGAHAGISPFQYFLAQGHVILRYFRLLLLPFWFNVDPDIKVPPVWLGLLLWAAIIALAVLAWKRSRAGLWLAGGLLLLLPSSSIFPTADLAADYRIYLPGIALAAAAAIGMPTIGVRIHAKAVPAAAVVLVLFFAIRSAQQTAVWEDDRALWAQAVQLSPNKLRPRLQLARALSPRQALDELQAARRLAPDNPAVAAETGRVYLALGDAASALPEFGRALALAPRDARNYNNRGVALMSLGQAAPARQDFERALQLDPCLTEARANLERAGFEVPITNSCRK